MGSDVVFVTKKVEQGLVYVGYVKHRIELQEKDNWDQPTGKYFQNSFRMDDAGTRYYRRIYRLTKGFADTVSHAFETGEYLVGSGNWNWVTSGELMKIGVSILRQFNVTVPSTKIISYNWTDTNRTNMMTAIKNDVFILSAGTTLSKTTIENMGIKPFYTHSGMATYSWFSVATDFTEVEAMVAFKGDIYFVQNSWLYKHDATNETGPQPPVLYLSNPERMRSGFKTAYLMCGVPAQGKLLIVTKGISPRFPGAMTIPGNTFEVDIATKDSISVGDPVMALAVLEQRGNRSERLYSVDLSGTLSWKDTGGNSTVTVGAAGDWSNTKLMTTYEDRLFIVKGDNLLKLDPDTEETTVLANDFGDAVAMAALKDTICVMKDDDVCLILPHVLE